MQIICYAVLFIGSAWLVVGATSRRKIVAVALVGVMVLTLAGAPQPARAQAPGGILSAIQAVLSVINGLIQTALTAINTARTALSNLQQVTVWPQQLINQARVQVRAIVGQYRNLMAGIIHINLRSATLPVPQAFEALVRDHQVNNFSSLASAYDNSYGLIPAAS